MTLYERTGAALDLDWLIDICEDALRCATTCRDCEGPLTNGVCPRCAPERIVCEDEAEEEGMSEQAEREMEWSLELARCARDCRV
jgi:hypothetical protein